MLTLAQSTYTHCLLKVSQGVIKLGCFVTVSTRNIKKQELKMNCETQH
jgi:hypothetical protein